MILVKAVQKSAIQKACNLHIHYYCFRVLPMRLGTTKKNVRLKTCKLIVFYQKTDWRPCVQSEKKQKKMSKTCQ